MRFIVAGIICLVTGLAFTAYFVIDNQTLDPDQMATVKSACTGCHGKVPTYIDVVRVHDLHAALDCVRCHSYLIPVPATTAIIKDSNSSQSSSAKPPHIPHEIENRKNCLACHETGVGDSYKIPSDHTGRTNETCRLCHTTGE